MAIAEKVTAIGHGTPIDFFSSSDYEILCSPIKELQITKIHLHKYCRSNRKVLDMCIAETIQL